MTDSSATALTPSATEPDATEPDATEPDDTDATEAGRPPFSWHKLTLMVLAGLLVALSIAAVVFALQARAAAEERTEREAAMRYAQQTLLNLFTISAESLDEDIQQVLDGATGQFRQEFSQGSENLREIVNTNQVVSEGKIVESGLVRLEDDTATALLVVDVTVRNKENPEGGFDSHRVKLELERQGDQWLTSFLEVVG